MPTPDTTPLSGGATTYLIESEIQSLGMKSVRRPVSRVLSTARRRMDGHSSGTPVTGRLTRPTRTAIRKRITCRPYLVLLPVGLAVPPLLPEPRCALTAPFQPYPALSGRRRYHFCGAIPGVTPGGCYPSPCFRGARTFLSFARFALSRSHANKRSSSHLTRDEFTSFLARPQSGDRRAS